MCSFLVTGLSERFVFTNFTACPLLTSAFCVGQSTPVHQMLRSCAACWGELLLLIAFASLLFRACFATATTHMLISAAVSVTCALHAADLAVLSNSQSHSGLAD